MKKVCVVGLGYIGLPTASLLATKGYQVHGVDVKQEVVDVINKGKIHIYEPDLDILVKAAVSSGKLKASVTPAESDVFIIAVPTPFKDNHVPDLSYVQSATKLIAPYVASGNLIILESTSPVGTTESIKGWIQDERPDLFIANQQLYFAHCPERVLPGQIIRELVENDRIIGGIDQPSADVAKDFYRQFISGEIFTTTCRTAELAKLTENAFRDVNIAFANELSTICDELGVNVWELIKLANRHPRVNILQPGPGVGGHCIAVDPWFIVNSAPEQAKLIHQARIVNDNKPYYILDKVREAANKLKEPKIACLGLSFKKNIDDLRESPSMKIVEELGRLNCGKLLIVEPHIQSLPSRLATVGDAEFTDMQDAVNRADIVLLLVDHDKFLEIDRKQLMEKIIIDSRGLWT